MTLYSMSPSSGPATGGTVVHFDGKAIDHVSSVTFGGHAGTSLSYTSTSITVTSPPGAGRVSVVVSGETGSYEFRYTPSLASISPSSGPVTGGTSVTITGTGFSSDAQVSFGGTAASSVTVNSTTSITAVSPGVSGVSTVDVTVTTGGGTTATVSADRFTFLPVVTSISPNEGGVGGGTVVEVAGAGFTGATAVKFGSASGTALTVVSDGALRITSPAGTGQVDVTVVTPGGTSQIVAADQYRFVSSVTAINPTTGPLAGGTPVTIVGFGFTNSSSAKFGGTAGTAFQVVNDNTITVTSPAGSGTVDVTVVTNGVTSPTTAADQFTYDKIGVTGVSPPESSVSGGVTVTLTGFGFGDPTAPGFVAPTVSFGGVAGTNVSVSSDGSLTVTVPAGAAGVVGVTVSAGGSTSVVTSSSQFTYNPDTAATGAAAEQNEESGTTPLAGGAGSGKYFQLMVPDFRNASTATTDLASSAFGALNSYLRMGAPRSDLASVTTPVPASAVPYGEDLAHGATTGDPDIHTLGGARDHTDGHRVITTRGSRLEVVKGQSRTLILGGQPIPATDAEAQGDPQWTPPGSDEDDSDGTDSIETSVVEHSYANTFYESVATTTFAVSGNDAFTGDSIPGNQATFYPPPHAEPRRSHASLASGEIYEYMNGVDVTEILAATNAVVEKTYADKVLEITSTIHANYPGWEAQLSSLNSGDLYDYMLASNIYEVARATGDYNDTLQAGGTLTERVYGNKILEITSALPGTWADESTWGATGDSFNNGDVWEYTVGHRVREATHAQQDIDEEIVAGGGISEITTAIGAINEFTMAAVINEMTIAPLGLLDLMFGGVGFLDVMASVGYFIEVMTALNMLEVYVAPSHVDVNLGEKTSFELSRVKVSAEEAQVIGVKSYMHAEVTMANGTKAELNGMSTIASNIVSFL